MVGLADLYADQKRTDDALRVLEQARKTFGDDQALTMRLANVYEGGGRLGEAEKELRQPDGRGSAQRRRDEFAQLHAGGAQRCGCRKRSISRERAVKIEPGNPAYLDTLGWALFKQGRAEEAAEPLGKAAAMLTGNSVIQDHHGDVLAKRGRNAEAIAAWQRALAGDGERSIAPRSRKKIKAAKAQRNNE